MTAKKRTKPLPEKYEKRMIRMRVQGWLFEFNAGEPVTLKGDISIPQDLNRRQIELLADFLAERIYDGKK